MKMKVLFCALALAWMFSSCKKEPAVNPDGSAFGFTVDGQNYTWNFIRDSVTSSQKGAFIRPSFNPNTNQRCYELRAWDSAAKISMWCLINTSVLSADRFNVTTLVSDAYVSAGSEFNGEKYLSAIDDVVSVTITSLSGKYASGSFSVVMHGQRSSNKELRIYNGNFSNILIQ